MMLVRRARLNLMMIRGNKPASVKALKQVCTYVSLSLYTNFRDFESAKAGLPVLATYYQS